MSQSDSRHHSPLIHHHHGGGQCACGGKCSHCTCRQDQADKSQPSPERESK